MTVEMHIFTRRFLGTSEAAVRFLNVLENVDLLPGKIGLYEPMRQPFHAAEAVDLWCRTTKGATQIAGGLMAKNDSPKFTFSVSWAKGPNARPGYLYFLVSDKDFRSNHTRFMEVFQNLFACFDGLFGYVSEEKTANRQHVTGTLETRLPGLFWCTAMGDVYVDWFGGEQRVLGGPWHQTKSHAGGVLLYLAESPLDKQVTSTPTLEQVGKEYLGVDSFGDPDAFGTSPDVLQVKRVPRLELPEIRVPLS